MLFIFKEIEVFFHLKKNEAVIRISSLGVVIMLPLLMPGNTSFMLREKITEFATEDILGHIKVYTYLMLLHVKH